MTQPTNEQKSRVIFEALKLGECWHEWHHAQTLSFGDKFICVKCEKPEVWRVKPQNPNYFARDLPDNIRVDMVTAAFDRWGMLPLMTAAGYIDGQKSLRQPTSVIAEAIYTLIQEQSDDQR